MHDLIPLARQCDELVFIEPTLDWDNDDLPFTNLINLAKESSSCSVALILALNFLESTIRVSSGNVVPGKAPLLKDLLLGISTKKTVLAGILNCLLLPTGLNLRNLLWHGFIGSDGRVSTTPSPVLRPWLALVLVIIRLLQNNNHYPKRVLESMEKRQVTSPLFRNAPNLCDGYRRRLMDVVDYGSSLRQQIVLGQDRDSLTDYIGDWFLPPSHRPLWDFCVTEMKRPNPRILVTSVALIMLLEHGLRLQWCQANGIMQHASARRGYFYVTLDGHGQKHKHDVLLHPFLCHTTTEDGMNLDGYDDDEANDNGEDVDDDESGSERNMLGEKLGANTMALLVDLFISGSGGPNLRAAFAHGIWDEPIKQEVASMASDNAFWDIVDVLLVCMEQAAIASAPIDAKRSTPSCIKGYHPLFSYTASTRESLYEQMQRLHFLSKEIDKSRALVVIKATMPEPEYISHLLLPPQCLEGRVNQLLDRLPGENWNAEIVLREHESNKLLQSIGATRSLLIDLAIATFKYQSFLSDSITAFVDLQNEKQKGADRLRRKTRNMVAQSESVLTIYSFATFVAVICLENVLVDSSSIGRNNLTKSDLLTASERTRMVVSTVSSFVHLNAERSFRAIEQYSRGKAIKKIIALKNF
jgi:hypothetical protein